MLGALDQGTDAQLLTHHLAILPALFPGSKPICFKLSPLSSEFLPVQRLAIPRLHLSSGIHVLFRVSVDSMMVRRIVCLAATTLDVFARHVLIDEIARHVHGSRHELGCTLP